MVPFLILVLSVGVKLWMALFQPKTGKPHSVEGDAGNVGGFHGRRDHDERNDRFYIDLPFPSVNIDAIAGLVVAVLVMWSGIFHCKRYIGTADRQGADPDLYARIMKEVASMKEL